MGLNEILQAYINNNKNYSDLIILQNTSLKEFYNIATGKNIDDISEESKEYVDYLLTHFELKTNQKYIEVFEKLEELYYEEQDNERRFIGIG